MPENYKEIINTKEIILRENATQITFLNHKQMAVIKIKIDGGLVTDTTVRKCDYLLLCGKTKAILVELKGNKIMDAIEQLFLTLDIHEVKSLIASCCTKAAFAVVVKINPKFNAKIAIAKRQFREKQCVLNVVNSRHQCNLL
jgi:hypothetical protein